MMDKTIILAPNISIARMCVEFVGKNFNHLPRADWVWVDPRSLELLFGTEPTRIIEATSSREFGFHNAEERKRWGGLLFEARSRWSRTHGALWIQVNLL